jgi:DnaJ-class molecular chaperone
MITSLLKKLFRLKKFDNAYNVYAFANKETAKRFVTTATDPEINSGEALIVDSKQCPTCHGTKTVEIHETRMSNGKKTDRIFDEKCEDCNGTGQVTEYTKSVYEI